MKEVSRKNCKLIYGTDESGVTTVTRCIPADGFYLFEVRAAYAKTQPPSIYYILARTKNNAVRRFKNTIGIWLKAVSVRMIPPGREAESILTNPVKMPLG